MNKNKVRYYQEYFRTDFENPVYHLILIECIDDVPRNAYIIQIPKLDVRFSINPYIYN